MQQSVRGEGYNLPLAIAWDKNGNDYWIVITRFWLLGLADLGQTLASIVNGQQLVRGVLALSTLLIFQYIT